MGKYYSVRVKSAVQISAKAVKVTTYDGAEDIIPLSQIAGWDNSRTGTASLWISAWILEQKTLQYSTKKWALRAKDGHLYKPTEVKVHEPEKVESYGSNEISELER